MLGDTAVAVNPKDDRYKNFIGKKILVPIVNREVKIISDNYLARFDKFCSGYFSPKTFACLAMKV